MPTYTKYREKSSSYGTHNLYDSRAYSGRRLYTNTSSAYDYPLYPERTAVRRQEREVQPRRKTTPARNHARLGIVKVCAFAAVVFILCFSVIYRYSVILETNHEIKALEKQYESILTENQLMQAKIDRYLEMGEVEKIAREELGMMKPESNQVFYIDMEMSDLGEMSASMIKEGGSAISGTPGALVNAFKIYQSYTR